MKKLLVVLLWIVMATNVALAEEAHIDGVLRVFMHQPGDYSVMTSEENGEYKIYRIWPRYTYGSGAWLTSVSFFSKCYSAWSGVKVEQVLKQLPKNEKKMYLLATGYLEEHKIIVTIFITSEKDVDGGDWEVWFRHNSKQEGRTAVVR